MKAFPNDDMLTGYANGALPAGLSLLVACHLTYSPETRRRLAALERLGGAVLAEEPLDALAPPSFEAVLARIDAETRAGTGSEGFVQDPPRVSVPAMAAEAPRSSAAASVMPAPLRAAMGMDEHVLPWKFRLPGLHEYIAEGLGEADEEVSMLRARPGAPMFLHTHSGVETTLILSGEMEDRGEVYRAGDVALANEEDDHRPRIVGDETCICLVVMTGSMKFTGTFSRALNIFT